jgi:hypothetical protein
MPTYAAIGERSRHLAALIVSLLVSAVIFGVTADRADAHHLQYCGYQHSAGYSHGLARGYFWSQFAGRAGSNLNYYIVYYHDPSTGRNRAVGSYTAVPCTLA